MSLSMAVILLYPLQETLKLMESTDGSPKSGDLQDRFSEDIGGT